MAELVQSQTGSSSVVQQQQASASGSSSAAYSFSSSSSFSASSSSSSSSSTKVVKQSTTSVKQSSSSSSMMSSSSSTSSKMVSIQSSGLSYSDRLAVDLGIADVNKEMERLQLRLGDEMANIHRDIFRLMPGSPEIQPSAIEGSGTSGLDQFLVKMDNDAIKSCIDKAHDDRVKLNFDVNEFDSETINIRTVGNKIEVHAMKKSKKGDEERSEEFTRVYELPNELDPNHVTSSIYNDGVLTIELPVSDALGSVSQ